MRECSCSFYGISLGIVICFYRVAFGLRIIGRENIPSEGPLILASNHISNFDAPALASGFAPRHLSYFAKAELFKFKPFAWLIGNLNAFPVDRSRGDVSAMRLSLSILQQGRALLVFPEGGRNTDGSAVAKNGVAFLAKNSGVPVVPAYVDGTKRMRFRHPVTVIFGSPMYYQKTGPKNEAMSQWSEELMESIKALKEKREIPQEKK